MACNFIKKETLVQMFSCEFCEIPKNRLFTEHLWTTVSVICCQFSASCFILQCFQEDVDMSNIQNIYRRGTSKWCKICSKPTVTATKLIGTAFWMCLSNVHLKQISNVTMFAFTLFWGLNLSEVTIRYWAWILDGGFWVQINKTSLQISF